MHILIRCVMCKQTRLCHIFSAAKEKESSTMGLSLKILSSFQAKSLTIMVANFFLLNMDFEAFAATFENFLTLHSVNV